MANFIWTGTDRLGRRTVEEVAAGTIEESKAMLVAEGYTDLELKSDEIMDTAGAGFSDKISVFGREVEVETSPEEHLKYMGNLSQTTLGQIFQRVVQDWMFYLLLIALLSITVFLGQTNVAIFVGIVGISWTAFRIWMALPEIYYTKLCKARDWHQWTKVLKLVKRAEAIQKMHFIKVPETELKRYRAIALAGSGKLAEALEEFRGCENRPGMPSWLYKAHIAEIFDIAKEHDKGLEYSWEAVEEKPTPTLYIDLVDRLLYYKKDTIKAREVLGEIEEGTLTEIGRPFYMRCHGRLAYLEGDYTLAGQKLEASLEIMEQKKNLPLMEGNINATKGYLCCVLARQGKMAMAKRYFAQVETYLIATEETELMEECKKLLGL